MRDWPETNVSESSQKPISSSTLRSLPAVPLLALAKLCRTAVYMAVFRASPLSLISTLQMSMTWLKLPFAPSVRAASYKACVERCANRAGPGRWWSREGENSGGAPLCNGIERKAFLGDNCGLLLVSGVVLVLLLLCTEKGSWVVEIRLAASLLRSLLRGGAPTRKPTEGVA